MKNGHTDPQFCPPFPFRFSLPGIGRFILSLTTVPASRSPTLRFPDLPAPLQLLFLLLRTRLSATEQQHAGALAATLTETDAWHEFLRLALHHRVAPLALHLMAGLPLDPPPAIRARLQKVAKTNAFHALEAATELAKLSSALGPANITALKGITLSYRLYGTPNARHVGDLDLLAAPGNLPAQQAALGTCGYTRVHPAARLTPRRIRAYQRFWKDATFRHASNGFELDLHWRLFNHTLHPANRLPGNPSRETVKIFHTPLPVLPAREQFLYSCAHGVSDAFTFAKSLADIAAFLRLFTQAQLDDALAYAGSIGLLTHCNAAIYVVNAWLGTEVASPHLLGWHDPLAKALHHHASAHLLAHSFAPTRDDRTPLAWLRWEHRLVPGPRASAERLRRFLWRPRPWSTLDLPDRLFWLYPAIGLLPRRRGNAEDVQPVSIPSSSSDQPL